MSFSIHLLEEAEKQKLKDREKKRLETLQLCMVELKKYFEPLHIKSLYLTGSLMVPYKFGLYSDIDIAVEGLAPDRYFIAVAELEGILSRKVEIIELEHCRFADMITASGIKII